MKKIAFLLCLVLIFAVGCFYKEKILRKFRKIYPMLEFESLQVRSLLSEIQKEIFKPQVLTPPPLKIEIEEIGFLTKEGIIKWTNIQREKYGLVPLKENETLNQSARIKLKDMFEKQYFAHTSPEGIGLKDLAEEVGYEFIVIGENLAMGNFKDDENLVLAWMKSPAHRDNILNEKFKEIGVAVEQGIFEGKKVWIAVCHFGKPLSACPKPNNNLKSAIEKNEKTLEDIEITLQSLRREIEFKKSDQNLMEKIDQYNNLVQQYNQLLKETQNLISIYNTQVQSFNECVFQ